MSIVGINWGWRFLFLKKINIKIYSILYYFIQWTFIYILRRVKSLLVSKGRARGVFENSRSWGFSPEKVFLVFYVCVCFSFLENRSRSLSLSRKGLVVVWKVRMKMRSLCRFSRVWGNAAFSHYVVDPKEKLLKSWQLFGFLCVHIFRNFFALLRLQINSLRVFFFQEHIKHNIFYNFGHCR